MYSKMICNTDISKSVLKYVCVSSEIKKKRKLSSNISFAYLLSDVLTNLTTRLYHKVQLLHGSIF